MTNQNENCACGMKSKEECESNQKECIIVNYDEDLK